MSDQITTRGFKKTGELYTQEYLAAVASMLDIMAQIYQITLTETLSDYWKKALTELSPTQIERGFMRYTQGENCKFIPKPGQIISASGYVWSPPPAKINTTLYFIAECAKCAKKFQSTVSQADAQKMANNCGSCIL